jgi:hypothetical protein
MLHFETLLMPHWHLVLVSLLLLWMAVFYWVRFVRPAQQLRVLLDRVNQQLDPELPQNAPAQLKLQDIERKVMTDAGLRHLWRQYAHTLHARWMPPDAGPLGVARARVSALSKSFFAEMNAAAHGERIDLSDIEQFTQSDPHMADLWARYNEALQEQQALEASQQNQTGGWQATAPAEHFFSEHGVVDARLQTHFFKHVPGILTGVGIIGTFTGLIVGLLGFDVSSPDRVQAALSQLVQTVGQAFMVSALAIGLAMVFTWVEKALLAARYRQVAQLQQHLDSLFAPKGGAEYMERLALATEMQVALSYKILSQLRSAASTAPKV